MPDTSYDFLTDFFVNYLPFTPTPSQIQRFQNDLALVSPLLMRAALKEVREGIAGNILVYTPHQWRSEIFKIYNRKVAEHAQLFPVFHSFETAFRSTVAVTLECYYNHARWWAAFDAALRAGVPSHSIKQISGMPVTRDASDVIGRIVSSLQEAGFRVWKFDNGYQFTECCDLSHIGLLIDSHWPVFGPRFGKGSTRDDFRAKFRRVRDARNDIYHHKSVARMSKVVSTAEELLDYLDFSLRFVCTKVGTASPTPLIFNVAVQTRHGTW